jgi:hypothetical protein
VTNIFNYKALSTNVCNRYNEYQNPNVIMHVDNMIPLVWPDYTICCYYYANPLVLGHRVILQNGAVLGVRNFKQFFQRTTYLQQCYSSQALGIANSPIMLCPVVTLSRHMNYLLVDMANPMVLNST